MRRAAFLAGLLLLVLLAGAATVFVNDTTNTANEFQRNLAAIPWGQTPFTTFIGEVEQRSLYWLKVIGANKEILFYGAVGFFGLVMMSLSIGRAAAKPEEKRDTMLEVLKREKEHAEKLARAKAEFLNQVSHELRTPLAVIIGYVECLADGLYGQIDKKHQDILLLVGKQSSHLRDMIDQILIFSRLEASKQPLQVQEFYLNTIMDDLRETFDFWCKQKGLELDWEVPDEDLSVRTDPARLKEVISNLLQNAIKYTERGSISVRLRKLRTNDSIILEVADTGIGIPEKLLGTIFDPFMQVHKTSTENSRGGIGLGLSIVKKHLEQLRGTITVESELGKGSTFKVILPRFYEEPRSTHRSLLHWVKRNYAKAATRKFSRMARPAQRVVSPRHVA